MIYTKVTFVCLFFQEDKHLVHSFHPVSFLHVLAVHPRGSAAALIFTHSELSERLHRN